MNFCGKERGEECVQEQARLQRTQPRAHGEGQRHAATLLAVLLSLHSMVKMKINGRQHLGHLGQISCMPYTERLVAVNM
jgi:hypothetical protein